MHNGRPEHFDGRRFTVEPRRVEDFRVDEVEITEQDYYRLPARARQLIEAYAEHAVAPPGRIRFRIAIYRWAEINQVLGESSIKSLRVRGASQ